MKVTINVTQEDIDNGKPASPSHCPVALAARRTFNVPYLHANYSQIHNGAEESPDCVDYAKVTHEMYHFMRVYDNSGVVVPTSFEVESLVQL